MNAKACLKSMRLRTLPLSLSGVIVGIALAGAAGGAGFSACAAGPWLTVAALILTAALLQLLSNLSNELGDALHGTDTPERLGMRYSIMDGEMTVGEMKRLIAATALLCCGCGLMMILFSFGTIFAPLPAAFILLGGAAVWAAMHYTMGDNPYGYRGLGDIFVFVFFGLVSTLGSAFICTHSLEPLWALPAVAIGLFSVGVLNVNNIRDMPTDAATRRTVALRMGPRRARIYQTALILAGWALMIAWSALSLRSGSGPAVAGGSLLLRLLYLLAAPLFALHLRGIWKRDGRGLDPMLPLLVLGTFSLALLFALGSFLG